MSKKMGRPKSDEPKKFVASCKLTEQENRMLEYYCKLNNISKAEVLKNGILEIVTDKKSE